MKMDFRRAKTEDVGEILGLYREMIGLPGCTWVKEYPDESNILEDLEKDGLFLLTREGRIIGAASCAPFEELEGLTGFAPLESPCELARVAVRRELQGQGLARTLILEVFEEMRSRGHDGVRLLVSPENPRALSLYAGLGFRPCGRTHMYFNDYILCELKWNEE